MGREKTKDLMKMMIMLLCSKEQMLRLARCSACCYVRRRDNCDCPFGVPLPTDLKSWLLLL